MEMSDTFNGSPYRRHRNDVEAANCQSDGQASSSPFDVFRTKDASVHRLKRWRMIVAALLALKHEHFGSSEELITTYITSCFPNSSAELHSSSLIIAEKLQELVEEKVVGMRQVYFLTQSSSPSLPHGHVIFNAIEELRRAPRPATRSFISECIRENNPSLDGDGLSNVLLQLDRLVEQGHIGICPLYFLENPESPLHTPAHIPYYGDGSLDRWMSEPYLGKEYAEYKIRATTRRGTKRYRSINEIMK